MTLPPAASAGCLPEATELPETAAPSQVAGDLVFTTETFRVPSGAHPHDVAVASDGGIWYTGQHNGTLGWLDPATGEVREAPLPSGAAPHGVVTGPDGAGWVTDQGLNAIVRVTPGDFEVDVFSAPAGTSPHTPVFDLDGILWFTGAGGSIGRLDPAEGEVETYPAPRGAGPYGITVTPTNEIWFVSLQQSYLGRVDKATGDVTVIEPPTANAGTRRVWSDSAGRLWISYWNAGMVAVYDPADELMARVGPAGRRQPGVLDVRRRARRRLDLRLRPELGRPVRPRDGDVPVVRVEPGERLGPPDARPGG